MKSHDELLSLNFENIKSRLDRIEKRLDGTPA
jgi:tetrahydromethanopterin S-methyltransferase subunit G